MFLGLALIPTYAVSAEPISFTSDDFRYAIDSQARMVEFVDRASGINYLASPVPEACASIRVKGLQIYASSAVRTPQGVDLQFGNSGVTVSLHVETLAAGVIFRVATIQGDGVEELTFLNIPLKLQGRPEESFAACAHALNLITRVDTLPVLQRELRASCIPKFGLVGAKVAITAGPRTKILKHLQSVLASSSELPVCRVAGPWADEIPFNHGSYLFNFGSLTKATLDEWIAMTKRLGFTQIDNHGGGSFFRFGDLELNRKIWPNGWDDWKRIVDRLHEQGIGSILHTYGFFIDKQSRYVTPVPDLRLDAFRTFTLAQPLTADATEILVNESTLGMHTTTGFFIQNSIVLHLGDELVTFKGVSQEAPWRFTGVQRGALGTKAASHAVGAKARHLKEMFGLFVPDVDSTLFEEIAARHADVINQCGFDGIYLDAIDGSSILRGPGELWYWPNKFVVEIQKRLKKPVGMEMSAMWHHFWQYRTRATAWDFPRRGHKRFIDFHAESLNNSLMLPLHLGWWGFSAFEPTQVEPTFPDVMETLGARMIGWNAGASVAAGLNKQVLKQTPLFARAVDILRTCEELRHSGAFDATARAKMREPGSEFALFKNTNGQTRFRRVKSDSHDCIPSEPWTLDWQVPTPYASQYPTFRIESLMSAVPQPGEGDAHSSLVSFTPHPTEPWLATTATGVQAQMQPAAAGTTGLGTLTATHQGKVPQNAAWAKWEKSFKTPLDLNDRRGLIVDIEGDGSGALLAIRMESPFHLGHGAVADHYIPINFTGHRQFVLVETESTRWSDYVWNDQKYLYHIYREEVVFKTIDKLSLWLQNIPSQRPTKISVGAIRAVPLQKTKLKRPQLTWAGKTLTFPVELDSGCWLECKSPQDCTWYGPRGELLGRITPEGDWPNVSGSANRLKFSCKIDKGQLPRGRITLTTAGEEL